MREAQIPHDGLGVVLHDQNENGERTFSRRGALSCGLTSDTTDMQRDRLRHHCQYVLQTDETIQSPLVDLIVVQLAV